MEPHDLLQQQQQRGLAKYILCLIESLRGEKLSSTAALLPDEMYVMEHPVHILWSVDSTTWQPLIALSHGFSIPLIASHQLQPLREIQAKNKKLCWPLLAAEI